MYKLDVESIRVISSIKKQALEIHDEFNVELCVMSSINLIKKFRI